MILSNDSIRRRLFALLLVVFASVSVAVQTARSEEFRGRDFEILFGELARNLENTIRGSLAIWRVSVDSEVPTGLAEESIRFTLDIELGNVMDGSDTVRFRYEEALTDAIQIQTVIGALATDRINVDALRRLREQNDLDFLLDVRVSVSEQRLRVEYRVLDLSSGALQTAGILGADPDPDPRVLHVATEALRSIRSGDRVFPASVVRYDEEMDPDPETRDSITLRLAARYPGQFLDHQYYSRYIVQGRSETEDALARESGGRHVPSTLRNYLRSIGVNLLLHVVTGPDGTIAKLVEVESGMVRGSAIAESGMTANMKPMQAADLVRLREVASETGKTGVLHRQYTSPSGALGVLGTGMAGHSARRLVLAEYTDHLLRSHGHDVLDHMFARSEMAEAGMESGAQIFFDPASRRRTREALGVRSMARVDVDGELLSITVVDAESLVARVIVSAAPVSLAAEFAGRFAREYAGTEGTRPVLLYTLDDGVLGISYPVRLLATAREMSLHAAVLDPALAQYLAGGDLGRRSAEQFTGSDFVSLASLGMGQLRLLELGRVTYDGSSQYFGRLLDVSSRTWPMIRMEYDDTPSQEVAREAFAQILRPVDARRTGRLTYQETGASALPTEQRKAVELLVQSWLSSERGWRISHAHYEGPLDHHVVIDDQTPAGSDLEVFIRVLDAKTGRVTAIGFVGVEDRVRRYDAPRSLRELGGMVDASVRLGVGGGPVVVLANPAFARAEPAVLANAIKQRLHARNVPLLDTVAVNSVSGFDDRRVIYELGAGRYLLPESYTHGTSLKLFDGGGFLTAVEQWPDEGVYEALSELKGLPELRSVAIGDLSLTVETTYERVSLERPFVEDAMLASLLRSGSTDVLDSRWASVFLQSPDDARYRVDATLVDNPVVFSINPSLLVVSRRTGDQRWYHVAELPVPESFYSAAPGSYIQTVVDEVSALSAREIVNAVQRDGLERELVVSLAPTVFRIEEAPNSILVEQYQDPRFVLAAKLAARLYSLLPETELLIHRDGRPQEPDAVVPDINFQEWREEFRTPATYARTYRVQQVVTRGGRRIGLSVLEPDDLAAPLSPDRLLRAGQLQALQELAAVVDQAERYAQSVRIADLQSELSTARQLLPRVIVFPEFHSGMRSRVDDLSARLQDLQGAATTQSVAAEAIVLIGRAEYRAARDLLRGAIRSLGEEEILVELLRQSEDLPRGIVGRIPSSGPLNNQSLREFSIAGVFDDAGEVVHASINIRPSGVYRVRTSGPAVVSYRNVSAGGTRIIRGYPEYVVVVDTDVPVDLTVTNTGSRAGRSFTVTFERDNDALYHLAQSRGTLANTTPEIGGGVTSVLVPAADPRQYRRHRSLTRAGWVSTATSVVSFSMAGFLYYAETTDLFGFQAAYTTAQANYDAATTTSAALEAATHAETAFSRVRLSRYGLYGSAITGAAGGLIAGISFLADSGYPSLEVDGPLFRVGIHPDGPRVSLQLTRRLKN